MKEIIIGKNEAGQRLDKLLAKYLDTAPKSFIYKMLRKKNIKLNDKKADGPEKLEVGDKVQIYISDESLGNFRSTGETAKRPGSSQEKMLIERYLSEIAVLYEDEDVLIIKKPAGLLSQKAAASDVSAVEVIIEYLFRNGEMTEEELESFRPSVCNRLDRNTSGILLCGKSLTGLQELSKMLKERTLSKFYLAGVCGCTDDNGILKGSLVKDEKENRVTVSDKNIIDDEGSYIETRYRKLKGNSEFSLLEVELITGKTHQIRAHLASIGHPVIGDAKYGDQEENREHRRMFGAKSQMLHACRVVFPADTGSLKALSGKEIKAEPPETFSELMRYLDKRKE